MSFYRLPHPWDPGYAIPNYVMAEPPERGTFTTQWMPRGTIPALVPDFIADPGRRLLGRNDAGLGSLGGHTLSCSTLSEPTLKGHSLEGDSLSGLTSLPSVGGQPPTPQVPDAIGQYGLRAARTMIARVSQLPKDRRVGAMKEAMRKIDPTLPGRAEAIANRARARGVAPRVALEHGIATAISQGMTTQLQQIGKSRRARTSPQSSSLLGLGRSRNALGADTTFSATMQRALVADIAALPVQPVICTGYSWVAPTTTTAGRWTRTRVGAADVPGPGGGGPSPAHRAGITTSTPQTTEMVNINGLKVPVNGGTILITTPDGLANSRSKAAWPWIVEQLRHGKPPTLIDPAKSGGRLYVSPIVKDQNWAPWLSVLGMDAHEDFDWVKLAGTSFPPIVKIKHPKTGDDWGVWLDLSHNINGKNPGYNGTPNEVVFRMTFKKVPDPGYWGSAWNSIVSFAATIEGVVEDVADVVEDIVNAVTDFACDLVSSSVGQAAAGAAGGSAGAKGAQIAGQLCNPTPPPPPQPAATGGWMTWLLLGGVGLAVAVVALKD